MRKGSHHTPEARKKQSESHKGRTPWNKGKKASESTRKKISEAGRNRVVSKETRRKHSEYMKGNQYTKGRKMPESEKQARSDKFFSKSPEEQLVITKNLKRGGEMTPNQKRSSLRNLRKGWNLSMSHYEKDIANYLRNYFTVYSQHFISDSYCHPYDLCVVLPNTNLLIEFDGDYIHSKDNPNWSAEADDKRQVEAELRGYSYLVIKEHDYNKYGTLKYLKAQVAKFYPEFANMHLSDRVKN